MSNKNITGIAFTIVTSVFFILTTILWADFYKVKTISVGQIMENERIAYHNLKKIAVAQEKYIQTDWDKDGVFKYSQFLVHLWKTVISKDGQVVKPRLIPKKLGFATESSTALNGYMYMILHDYLQEDFHLKRMDYSHEWAVYASPLEPGLTGNLFFIIDHTGTIMVSKDYIIYNHDYPYQALKNGWQIVNSPNDLKKIQAALDYHPR